MNRTLVLVLIMVIIFTAIIIGIWLNQPRPTVEIDVNMDPKDIIDAVRDNLKD